MKRKKSISREEQKKQTEILIIQASIKVFSKNGIFATKTLEIAKEAGLSHGALFVHFPTKQELVIGVIREIERRVLDKLSEILRPDMTLRELLFGYLDVVEEYEVIYSRLVTESFLFPEEVRNTLLIVNSGLTYYMYKIVVRDVSTGKSKDIPHALFFNTWISLIYYYLAHRDLFAPRKSVIREKRNELVEHFLSLIHR